MEKKKKAKKGKKGKKGKKKPKKAKKNKKPKEVAPKVTVITDASKNGPLAATFWSLWQEGAEAADADLDFRGFYEIPDQEVDSVAYLAAIESACETADAMVVAELIEDLDLSPEQVAVEVNGELVPRAERAAHQLSEGDAVELVTLVGGG